MIILTVFTAEIQGSGVDCGGGRGGGGELETGEKRIKIANQCFLFFYQRQNKAET